MNKKIIYLMYPLFFLNLSMLLSASNPLGSYLQDSDEDNGAPFGEGSLFVKKNNRLLPPLSSFPYPAENPDSLPPQLTFTHAYPEGSAGSLPPASTFTHAYPSPAGSITPSLRPLSLIHYPSPAGNTTSSLPAVSSFPYSSYKENSNMDCRPAISDSPKVYGHLTHALLNSSEKSKYTVATSLSSSYEAMAFRQRAYSLEGQSAMNTIRKTTPLLSFSFPFPVRHYEKTVNGITEFGVPLSFSFPETHIEKTSDNGEGSQPSSSSSLPRNESKKRKLTPAEQYHPSKKFKGDSFPETSTNKHIRESIPAPSFYSHNEIQIKTQIYSIYQNEGFKKNNTYLDNYFKKSFKKDPIVEKVFKKILKEKVYEERYTNNFRAPSFYLRLSSVRKKEFLIAIIEGTMQANIAANFNTSQNSVSKFSRSLSDIFDLGAPINRRFLKPKDHEELSEYCNRIYNKYSDFSTAYTQDFKFLTSHLVKYFDGYFPDLCIFIKLTLLK